MLGSFFFVFIQIDRHPGHHDAAEDGHGGVGGPPDEADIVLHERDR